MGVSCIICTILSPLLGGFMSMVCSSSVAVEFVIFIMYFFIGNPFMVNGIPQESWMVLQLTSCRLTLGASGGPGNEWTFMCGSYIYCSLQFKLWSCSIIRIVVIIIIISSYLLPRAK